jgi:hypothetical protein
LSLRQIAPAQRHPAVTQAADRVRLGQDVERRQDGEQREVCGNRFGLFGSPQLPLTEQRENDGQSDTRSGEKPSLCAHVARLTALN